MTIMIVSVLFCFVFRTHACAQLSLVIKTDANLAGLYEDATEVEQVFIKKLALFFTGECVPSLRVCGVVSCCVFCCIRVSLGTRTHSIVPRSMF